MSRVLTRFFVADDIVAEARRAREAEWEAMRRRPDALPDPVIPPSGARVGRPRVVIAAQRVLRLRPGS